MKLEKIKIKNFRGYKDEVIIDIKNLTAFVGKNDVGKSTILEALDIFFNDKDATVKLDSNDLNKETPENGQIMISVCFSDYPNKIDIDAGNETNLKDEYLLNAANQLEIKKTFEKGKLKEVFVVANHPTNRLAKGLLEKKIGDLKKIVEDNNFECTEKTKKAELRKAIRDNSGDLQLAITDIPVKKEEAKAVWDKLQTYMPLYALFQSDRSNNDQDNEVQNPMKLAVAEILKNEELQNKFKEIAEEVKNKTEQIAKNTLDKLKEMNSKIAQELKPVIPNYDTLKWADVFKKIDITSDNDIPLNKRGSGIKRLVLLNFFRAEADRRKQEKNVQDIIYAIEEPETSQHPDHQEMLIEAFKILSQSNNTQILLTTHSPAIVKMLDFENLNIIKKENTAIKIQKPEEIRLSYKSLNEINYIAFDYVSAEYHNELYGFIESKHKDDIFKEKVNKQFTEYKEGFLEYKRKKNGTEIKEYITLQKYIRHQIHHPENKLNKEYTLEQLKESIQQMRNYLKNNP